MNTSEGTTVIGKSVRIVGDLSGTENLEMDGDLEGTIRLPGVRLTLGPSARVRGDISAQEIVILGRMDGDVRTPGRVELRASAVVQGNIYAGSLAIQENAVFRGQADPTRAGEPIPARTSGRPSRPSTSSPDETESSSSAPLFAETKA